ncbi:MAG: DUF4381 family protein [Chthoniobacterales bacterium]
MNPLASQPAATPAPIKDILSPIGYFPYPWWYVAIAALLLLALLGFLVWVIFLRKKKLPLLTVRQVALKKLEELRPLIPDSDPYAFGIRVSDVLRNFIEGQYGLAATTSTSIEFLESIRFQSVFTEEERGALALFLEKADLIKFARLHATQEDSAALLETAFPLVQKGKGTP